MEPREIIELLRSEYGALPRRPRRDPLDELVLGVLSQNTSDANSGHAFARLKEAFPDWQSLLAAETQRIEEAIRPGGLAPTKAVRIKSLLAPEEVYPFHMYLIEHGRRTCLARRPRCPVCVLRQKCPSASLFYPSA